MVDIGIIQLLWNPFQGLVDWFQGLFDGVLSMFFSIFTTPISFLLYSLQVGFFMIIDCIQGVFRSIAGLDNGEHWKDDGSGGYIHMTGDGTDIVYTMMFDHTVWMTLLSVLFVSIILVFITSIIAILRQEFTEKGAGNSKTKIIGGAVKSLVYFAVVPIVCIMGVFIANIFLRTFDQATRQNAPYLSNQVFMAASSQGNRARIDETIAKRMMKDEGLRSALGISGGNDESLAGRTYGDNQQLTQAKLANLIDDAFRENKGSAAGDEEIHISTNPQTYELCAWMFNGFNPDLHNKTFSVKNVQFVHYFYDIFWGYNYIIGFVGGFTMAMLMLSICLGLIQRIYELIILFMISPAFIAFMPLDDGKKYEGWRGQFVSRVGMAYGPVIGMNLFLIVVPVLQGIYIFDPTQAVNIPFNAIMQLIFLVVGLLAVKEFSQMISGLLGQTDALNVGQGKKEGTQKMMGRIAGGSVAAAKMGQAVTKASLSRPRSWVNQSRANSAADRNKELLKEAEAAFMAGDTKKGEKLAKKAQKQEVKSAMYSSRADEAKKNGLGSQLNMALQGQGKKTEIFGAWGNFLKSAGPDVGYFSRDAIAKRSESGESGLAQMDIWANKHSGGKTLGETFKNMRYGRINPDTGKWEKGKQDLFNANRVDKEDKEAKDAAEAEVARTQTNLSTVQAANDDQIAAKHGLKRGANGKYSAADQAVIDKEKNAILSGTAGSIGTLNVKNLNLDKALVKGDGSAGDGSAGASGAGGGSTTIKTDGDALNITGDVGIRDGTQIGLTSDSFEPLKQKLETIAKDLSNELGRVATAISDQSKEIKTISDSVSGTYKPQPGGKDPMFG